MSNINYAKNYCFGSLGNGSLCLLLGQMHFHYGKFYLAIKQPMRLRVYEGILWVW